MTSTDPTARTRDDRVKVVTRTDFTHAVRYIRSDHGARQTMYVTRETLEYHVRDMIHDAYRYHVSGTVHVDGKPYLSYGPFCHPAYRERHGLDAPKCATVGCSETATHTITYSFPESREKTETDRVCLPCASGYAVRPSLLATLTAGIAGGAQS